MNSWLCMSSRTPVLNIPGRDNLVFLTRDGVTDTIGESIMLLDQSGNDRHMTVVSGTSWADFVLTAPAADATWIAADTGNVFYDGAGDPIEVSINDLYDLHGDRFFFGQRGLYCYSEDQTEAAKILRYVRPYLQMLDTLEMLDNQEMYA